MVVRRHFFSLKEQQQSQQTVMLALSGRRWRRRGHSFVAWCSVILLEERSLRSLLVPSDLDKVLHDVRAIDAQRERRVCLEVVSANVSCMYTLETGEEGNAMSLAPT